MRARKKKKKKRRINSAGGGARLKKRKEGRFRSRRIESSKVVERERGFNQACLSPLTGTFKEKSE